MPTDLLAQWGLDEMALAIYETALADPGLTDAQLAEAANRPVERVAPLVGRLCGLGLLEASGDGRIRAAGPLPATARLAGERLRSAATDAVRAAELLAAMDRLAAPAAVAQGPAVRSAGPADLAEQWRRIASSVPPDATLESLAVIPDTAVFEDIPEHYPRMLVELLESGRASLRCIVTPECLFSLDSASYAAIMDAKAAEFRTATSLPSWFYVIGSRVAGIPALWGRSPSGAAMTHRLAGEPAAVAVLQALFEELWRRAMPVRPTAPSCRDRRSVLRLLAQGLSDEATARRLGLSVRTVRTRVAEAMAELGARTRFEAAVTAARHGWFD